MKKLVSCMLAAAMLLNLLLIALPVAADAVYSVDFSAYDTIDAVDGWKGTSTDYVAVQMCGDGLQLLQTATKLLNDEGTRNTATSGSVYGGITATLETDEANRTVLTAEQLRGAYDINIRYKANVDRLDTYEKEDGSSVPIEGYYNLTLGTMSNPANPSNLSANTLYLRINPKNVQVLNQFSQTQSTMSPSAISADNLNGAEHTITISIDTERQTQTVMLDNDAETISSGAFGAARDYVNGLVITGMERMNTGAYFTFQGGVCYPAFVRQRNAGNFKPAACKACGRCKRQ